MDKIYEQLYNNKLFTSIDPSKLRKLTSNKLSIRNFSRNNLLVQEGDLCDFIAIILEGHVFIQKLFASGSILTINTLKKNSLFGAAILFSKNNHFPYSIMSATPCKILFIKESSINELLHKDFSFTKNYIEFLSNRINIFSDKINLLLVKDVRSKLILYINSEMQKNKGLTFMLSHTREEIANIIGVARPSVSRELKKMVDDKLIKINKRKITVINLDSIHLPTIELP